MSNQQIISKLEGHGYNSSQIAESMNQMGIKNSIESGSSQNTMQPSLLNEEEIPVPSPPQGGTEAAVQPSYTPVEPLYTSPSMQPISYSPDHADVQEIIESIVEERWQRFSDTLTDVEVWRSRVNDDLVSIKQEILRVSNRFEILQKSVLGKVDEYGKGITEVSSEIKALEKVFQGIINPLTSNIKELSRITTDLKKR